jgi:hypothetical protein
MILEKDFVFYKDLFKGIEYIGEWLEIHDGFCKIKKGAYSNGATGARDENAFFTWMWHDNAYEDKNLPLSRKVKDLIMMDMLKTEGFRWFRYSWIRKGKGFNTIWAYYIGVRMFGWLYEK